ncbi:hypothetical protein [Leekyejoonella antrihumi]|uniref:hypothetical protein n=1 Tax=Leekyejoonella antrihumi TaxID=1660198 RepID=UPI0016482D49|nr:hypothetical protein [Leekyejoonella antrihumi]
MTNVSDLGNLEAIERERLRAIVEADESVLWSLHDPDFGERVGMAQEGCGQFVTHLVEN